MKPIEIKMKGQNASLLASIKEQTQTKDAICELIDNAFDSGASVIDVKCEDGNVSVTDNGSGIPYKTLLEIFSNFSAHVGSGENTKGFWGLGMKNSAFALAKNDLYSNKDAVSHFQLDTWHGNTISRVEWTLTNDDALLSTTKISEIKKKDTKLKGHGTCVSITNCVELSKKIKETFEYTLARMYAPTLNEKRTRLIYNGKGLEPEDLCYLDYLSEKELNTPGHYLKHGVVFRVEILTTDEGKKMRVVNLFVDHAEQKRTKRLRGCAGGSKKAGNNGVPGELGGVYVLYNGRYITLGNNFSFFNKKNGLGGMGCIRTMVDANEWEHELGVGRNKGNGVTPFYVNDWLWNNQVTNSLGERKPFYVHLRSLNDRGYYINKTTRISRSETRPATISMSHEADAKAKSKATFSNFGAHSNADLEKKVEEATSAEGIEKSLKAKGQQDREVIFIHQKQNGVHKLIINNTELANKWAKMAHIRPDEYGNIWWRIFKSGNCTATRATTICNDIAIADIDEFSDKVEVEYSDIKLC